MVQYHIHEVGRGHVPAVDVEAVPSKGYKPVAIRTINDLQLSASYWNILWRNEKTAPINTVGIRIKDNEQPHHTI